MYKKISPLKAADAGLAFPELYTEDPTEQVHSMPPRVRDSFSMYMYQVHVHVLYLVEVEAIACRALLLAQTSADRSGA